jgi:hypothetical protein
MRERQPVSIGVEAKRVPEIAPRVLSFGKVDDLVEELTARPPEGRVVRMDACIQETNGQGAGLKLRAASVLITARRGDEVLVANMVHSYYRTFHSQPLVDRDVQLARENNITVQRVLAEQLQEQGFTIGRGSYALPENLTIYHSTSDRIVFKDHKAYAKAEIPELAVKEVAR